MNWVTVNHWQQEDTPGSSASDGKNKQNQKVMYHNKIVKKSHTNGESISMPTHWWRQSVCVEVQKNWGTLGAKTFQKPLSRKKSHILDKFWE